MFNASIIRVFPFLFLLNLATAFKVDFWTGKECRGQAIQNWVGGASAGCQTVKAGEASSVEISSTGAVDDWFVTTFYSSEDCDPNTQLGDWMEETSGCKNFNYKSFRIWDVGPNTKIH